VRLERTIPFLGRSSIGSAVCTFDLPNSTVVTDCVQTNSSCGRFAVDAQTPLPRIPRTYLPRNLRGGQRRFGSGPARWLHKPDLVILDFAMPMMSGVEAGIRIRKLYPSVPIIVFTMHAPVVSKAHLPWATKIIEKDDILHIVSIAEELVAA
jgi:CheY-like chemotaxis protein